MPSYASMSDVPAAIREKAARYFSDLDGPVFVVRGLPAEMAGGAMARYSRARGSLRLTLVNEFLDGHGEPDPGRGSDLMDRVLNAFGDDSVGELEGAHVGVEGISQVATKWLEDRRVGGSPIEQSTRYVLYDRKDGSGRWRYLRPPEIMASGLGPAYEEACDAAFGLYSRAIPLLSSHYERLHPRAEFRIEVSRGGGKAKVGEDGLRDEAERRAFDTAWRFTVRCAALDVARGLLPASTLTQLGLFGNGRYYTGAITFLLSQDLQEARDLGRRLAAELAKAIPTFVKRARRDELLAGLPGRMRPFADLLPRGVTPAGDTVVSLAPRADLQDEVLAACLYPFSDQPLARLLAEVRAWPAGRKADALAAYAGRRETRRDRSGRGLEAGYPITFDLTACFAEYRDVQRHRMLTQQRQALSPELGFHLPPEMAEVGLEREALEVEARMRSLHRDLRRAGLGAATEYAVLFNHRCRFLMGMNLRELQHLAELRSQGSGHGGYRKIARDMAAAVLARDPWAAPVLGFVAAEGGPALARAAEQARIAGKNLRAGVDGGVDLG